MSKIYEYLYFEVFSIKLYKYIIKFIYKPPKRTIRIFRQKYYVIAVSYTHLDVYKRQVYELDFNVWIRNGKKEKGQKSIISVLLYFSNSRHTVP